MSTLSQRIAALKRERAEKVAAYEAVVNKSGEENRDISDEEQTALDALKEDIDGRTTQITRLEASEELIAKAAVPVVITAPEREAYRGGLPAVVRLAGRVHDQDRDKEDILRACGMLDYPGAGFTRMAIAMAVAGPFNAAAYARQRWGSELFAEVIQRIAMHAGSGTDWLQRAVTPPMEASEAVGG